MTGVTVVVGGSYYSRPMDRALSILLVVLALLAFSAAGILLLVGFIEYLQGGEWRAVSLLQFFYDNQILRARWFLGAEWSWWIHDLLELIPLYAALMAMAPLSWWLSRLIAQR